MLSKVNLILMACLVWIGGAAIFSAAAADSRSLSFNDGWRFTLADSPEMAKPEFDDSSWRSLSLPHDWAIEGDFSKDNPSGTGGGALPGGIGWYRKTFTLTPEQRGKNIFIDFDGAYMNSTVFINGHELGTRPYGYASFSYDITPWLNQDGENVIAVRVDNAEQPNSRWYSGCGIYRNVWLRTLSDIHIPLWGQHVTTPTVTDNDAQIDISTEIVSKSKNSATVSVYTSLIDETGKMIGKSPTQTVRLDKKHRDAEIKSVINIKSPHLWSTEDPYLYTLMTFVSDVKTGQLLDTYQTTTGLRYFSFDPKTGFALNGKPMKINGVCMHHDLGALGAAVNTRGIERQLEILKEMGANAYRASHNPPAPEVLDLCDRMGILVMDETFDMWRKKKTSHDYSRNFPEWHEKDLSDLLRRDRNHPSVIMWSIGNEVLEQWSDAKADNLSLEQANLILNFGHGKEMLASESDSMSVNSLLTKKLADMVRELDSSRPVTAGCNEPDPGNHLFRSDALDIIGYNYHDNWFDSVPGWFPDKPFIITESVSGLMTRGYYRMPSDSLFIWPKRWDIPFEDPSFSCSSYDNCHVPWGNSHEGTLRHVNEKDFISGQFIWTGFDYLGEPTPFGWPARSSYFGIVDLAGIPKDIYYMYQSQWRPDKNVLHLFPHWNWEEGQKIDMWAYYNNADEIELFVNGESQGVRKPEPGKYHASWRVDFTPGTMKAVSRKDGRIVATDEIRTAGEPYRIRLTPDRSSIKADGNDLSYVLVEILDKDGNLCPWADNLVTFDVTGSGRNEGVDNGSPISLERFKDNKRKAFYGKAMLIVRNDGTQGPATVRATSPGLLPYTTVINSF
ncbi:glycoside hydrolase family 2 TIM barrel-domain containing protein [uncultured Duncaniella sp.]|jgi:beta-galactosidase|uniref:glycoside hydrolase family 2 TIM barrel-domain containing protein n=4 Tax=uncultured Duncaniella sp. TaxID=2768039 RepID=UPI0025AF48B6|nr:glycoside hydrolase family 2 TIM barrel-domain containing protein [uncultured Duncaniella sp.]